MQTDRFRLRCIPERLASIRSLACATPVVGPLAPLVAIAFTIGCGGAAAPPAAAPASGPAETAASATGSASDAGVNSPGDVSTTTTSTLADASEEKGTKLADAPAGTGGSHTETKAGPKGHDHDPGRGPADIRAIVVAHRDEARACYDRAVADHPGIEGDLVITWTIDPKGSVVQTGTDSARSQISEPAVIDCISAIVKKLQFAPSPGGFETRASYPFNFHPHHTKQGP